MLRWPGKNPTCNGFILWTAINYNLMPLDQGAPGAYAMVLPNGMNYIPYYSWGFLTDQRTFPSGMVLRMRYLGFYMAPLFNSTFGTGFSCKGRCPCPRLPTSITYVGNGTLPARDDGPSVNRAAVVPSDLLFDVTRTYPANGAAGTFDGSWIDVVNGSVSKLAGLGAFEQGCQGRG
jgi:hypothetical protein